MCRKPGCDIIVVPPHRLPSDQILRGKFQIWASLLSSGTAENSQSKGKLVRMPFVSFQVWSGALYNLDQKYFLQLWWTSNSLDQLNCSCVRLWVTAVVVKLNWHLIFMPPGQFNSPLSALRHSLSSFCQVVADVFSIFLASPSKNCEDEEENYVWSLIQSKKYCLVIRVPVITDHHHDTICAFVCFLLVIRGAVKFVTAPAVRMPLGNKHTCSTWSTLVHKQLHWPVGQLEKLQSWHPPMATSFFLVQA